MTKNPYWQALYDDLKAEGVDTLPMLEAALFTRRKGKRDYEMWEAFTGKQVIRYTLTSFSVTAVAA